jgi:hypothetical protein
MCDAFRVGDKVMLRNAMLGNEKGTYGYVFNEYEDFDDPEKVGVQVIFPNGEYDGFSAEEQAMFLFWEGHDIRFSGYQFENVIQVSRDFDKGYWKW